MRVECVVRSCYVNDLRPPGQRQWTLAVTPLLSEGPGATFLIYAERAVEPGAQLWLVTADELRAGPAS